MADELDSFITALTTKLVAMTGIKAAPEHPPESLNEFPFAVTYFARGTFDYSQSGPSIGLHTVNVDIHLGRSMLQHDEKHARPFILRGLTMIASNLKMGGTCDHCLLKGYEYGGLGYGESLKTFGVRYVLEVKIKHAGITVAA